MNTSDENRVLSMIQSVHECKVLPFLIRDKMYRKRCATLTVGDEFYGFTSQFHSKLHACLFRIINLGLEERRQMKCNDSKAPYRLLLTLPATVCMWLQRRSRHFSLKVNIGDSELRVFFSLTRYKQNIFE